MKHVPVTKLMISYTRVRLKLNQVNSSQMAPVYRSVMRSDKRLIETECVMLPWEQYFIYMVHNLTRKMGPTLYRPPRSPDLSPLGFYAGACKGNCS
jgi:hypothetical protein